jgi:hypothetical protein
MRWKMASKMGKSWKTGREAFFWENLIFRLFFELVSHLIFHEKWTKNATVNYTNMWRKNEHKKIKSQHTPSMGKPKVRWSWKGAPIYACWRKIYGVVKTNAKMVL